MQQPTACDAFTAKFHPCRGYASHHHSGANLCEIHRGWYENFKWLDAIESGIETLHDVAQMGWFRRVLLNKAVGEIPTDLLGKRVAESNNPLLLDVCIRANRVPPECAWHLWDKGVKFRIGRIVKAIEGGSSAEFIEATFKQLLPYFNIWTSDMLLFARLVRQIVALRTRGASRDVLGRILRRCLEHMCFGTPENILKARTLCFSDTTLFFSAWRKHFTEDRGLPPNESETIAFLADSLQADLRSCAARMRQHLKMGLAPLKEDLMAAAWHPDRVERALAAGGIEGLEDL